MKPRKSTILVAAMFVLLSLAEIGAVNSKPGTMDTAQVSSMYALAGEFRTVGANLLWIKADQYHHEFLETNEDWTKDKDLLGLLKVITDLDPRFLEAYASAAVIYAYGLDDPARACALLEQGIHHNPKAWSLHRLAAIIYARRMNLPERALPHAQAAVRYCDSDFDKHVVVRLLHSVERMVKEKRNAPTAGN